MTPWQLVSSSAWAQVEVDWQEYSLNHTWPATGQCADTCVRLKPVLSDFAHVFTHIMTTILPRLASVPVIAVLVQPPQRPLGQGEAQPGPHPVSRVGGRGRGQAVDSE